MGPRDLYTSLLVNIIVDGVSDAIKSHMQKLFIFQT